MKKFIISLFVILSLVIISVFFLSKKEENIYTEMDTVKFDEVIKDQKKSNVPTIYYYYQNTCEYCNSIKGEVTKFYHESKNQNFDIKLVDMKDNYNQSAWYDWNAHNKKYGEGTDPKLNPNYIYDPQKMLTYKDVKVTGTPTMIYVKNGKILDYEVGKDVFKTMNKAIDESGSNLKLDSSVYGKGVS